MTRSATSHPPLLPADRRDTAFACGMFFFVLCAYYVLRPVRDEMAVRAGAAQLGWLFSATFVTMLCAAPLFGWVAARVATRWLAPCVLLFFASHLLVFRFALDASSLAVVAPGIAEALFATAIGLFVAIPAVWAYNRFTTRVERMSVRFETFAEEFSSILQRQSAGDE